MILRQVRNFLDAPWLRWTGNLWTLWSLLSLGFGLAGKIVESSHESKANLLIALGAISLLLRLLVTVLPKPATLREPCDLETETGVDEGELERAIESELTKMIDEWKAIRASEFTETANAPYSFLLGRTIDFIETILGRPEAQRFEDNGEEKPRTLNQLVDLRIRALSRLRDDRHRWHSQVDLQGLASAIKARKEVDYGSAILIADSPLESRYGVPSALESFTSSDHDEPNIEAAIELPPFAALAPKDGHLSR
jgi:hypothetical protein